MITNDEIRAHATEILDTITSNPERHKQATFWNPFIDAPGPDDCGTSACIAGWSLYLKKQVRFNGPVPRIISNLGEESFGRLAAKNLGLTTVEEADALFYEMNEAVAVEKLRYLSKGEMWPDDLRDFSV